MKKIIKQLSIYVATFALLAFSLVGFVPTSVSAAATNENVCKGVSFADGGEETCTEDGENTLSSLAKTVVNIFSIVVGAVSVIMIIVGGFRYIVSNGDSNAVQGAKNSILYAIVGLVIVLFAQVIVRFVLTNATNQT